MGNAIQVGVGSQSHIDKALVLCFGLWPRFLELGSIHKNTVEPLDKDKQCTQLHCSLYTSVFESYLSAIEIANWASCSGANTVIFRHGKRKQRLHSAIRQFPVAIWPISLSLQTSALSIQ